VNLRADARRNRVRILEAADAVFSSDGLAASTEQIARRAGVGIGTVFRHFPTKDDLVEAVVVHRIERLADEAERLSGDEAFFEFFANVIRQARANLALRDALADEFGPALASAKQRLNDAGQALLERAQAAGVVRKDVSADDLKALVNGCLVMEQHAPDPPGRMIEVVCAGLRP